MNILMISKSSYPIDIRVRREAETLSQGGHHVSVISTDPDDFESEGVQVIGAGHVTGISASRPQHKSLLYRAARWALLPTHRARAVSQFQTAAVTAATVLSFQPDVVHAHDYPALAPATNLARQFGAKVVYDAHEYWRGLPHYGRPEPIRLGRARSLEANLARQADRVITVSEGASLLLERDFGIEGIEVVRNTFPIVSQGPVAEIPHGAVYAGRIGPGRDLDTVFQSGIWTEGFKLHLMGPADDSMYLPNFAITTPTGSLESVDRLLGDVGISLVTLSAGPENHDIALPNKLFQAVARGVPVVATDLPEIAAVVSGYGIGELYLPGDPQSFGQAVTRLRDQYQSYRHRVLESQPELTWPTDANKLLSVYESM